MTRSVKTFTDVTATIGGFNTALTIICSILIGGFQQYKLTWSLLENLFEVKPGKKHGGEGDEDMDTPSPMKRRGKLEGTG